MIASVVVNVKSNNVDYAFTYSIPENIIPLIKVGSRVKVPFGQSNRLLMGYVLELKDELSTMELKDIVELVDIEPVLSEKQIELAKFIKEDTICPLIRILNVMVPSSLQLKSKKYLNIVNYDDLDANLATILGGKQVVEYTSRLSSFSYQIEKAIEKGLITISYDAIQQTKEKYTSKYQLNIHAFYDNISAFSQNVQDGLLLLKDEEPLSKSDIQDKTGLSYYMIDKCSKMKVLTTLRLPTSRVKIKELSVDDTFIKVNETYDEIINKFMSDVTLPSLWIPQDNMEKVGVIERIVRINVKDKKTTLIICSDILSSYRISSLLRKRTHLSVACLNSELSEGEYLDYYNEIKNDEYSVIVTTPKGSLLEYQNLQTIIMLDTESDNYYNDQSPRYDLKKAMLKYASIYNAKLIYQSFTPSIEEYVKGLKNINQLVESTPLNSSNYDVEVIDLKDELLRANTSLISQKLLKKIKITMSRGLQTLLITNRKFHSNYVMCRSCGEIVKCSRCLIPLQYSKKNNNLLCPACGTRYEMINTCPNCESQMFRFEGSGMEQLVEDLKSLLPTARIVKIDDSSYKENSLKMSEIENNEVDIILATAVLSKSVIETNLGLVAIINLDEITGNQSYTSNERAMSELVQTKNKVLSTNATMVIQTYDPNNYVLKDFIIDDFKAYVKEEITNRKMLRNTPFYFINRIFVKGKYEDMFKEAYNIKKTLQQMLEKKVYVIGPTYNHANQAVQLIIKHQVVDINNIYNRIYSNYQNSSVMIIFDKYPRYI